MNMMRVYKNLLTAAMVVALGFGMGSCADNIDNSTKPSDNPQQEQQVSDEQAAKAQKYWAIVGQLVDVDDYTDDYEDKTFEPVYGETIGSDTSTRYVFTNDAATAAERFADLVERDDIDENTQTYTVDDPDIGTFTYTKGTGRELATVGVRVKQIPSLKKIVYMPGAYANAKFDGRAYYRFGDVVKRQAEGYDGPVDEYWICVRPSFGPEKKGDSHWVCLNVLPKKNIWHYHSSTNSKDYYLPKGLSTNKEQMQNLAELLYAIYNPQKWDKNVGNPNNDKLRMFHDFNKADRGYHNPNFWQSVQNAWRHFNITDLALDMDSIAAREQFTDNEDMVIPSIRLLHSGHSWWTLTSWNCTLYEATYQNSNANGEQNMHDSNLQSIKKNMETIAVDCRRMGKEFVNNYVNFFDGDGIYRWAIRHATGKELSSTGDYSTKEQIDGVTDVYRYYRDVLDDPILTAQPEVTEAVKYFDEDKPGEPEGDIISQDNLQVGHVIGQSGQFYKDCAAAKSHNDEPMAMVAYLGGDMRVEKDKEWNGLAIALNDCQTEMTYGKEGQDDHSCVTAIPRFENMSATFDGWAMTKRLRNHECNVEHQHPAAEAVWSLPSVEGCSEWFIGGLAQWDLVMQGMGYGKWTNDNNEWEYKKQGSWPWKTIGAPNGTLIEDGYMTNTVFDTQSKDFVYNLFFIDDFEFINYDVCDPITNSCVRPFLAFKYGNGGSKNPE